MMTQWHQCKEKAKDALVLFRLGDFYEAFYEDAEIISKALNIILTKRQDIPMSGVPAHTFDAYVEKLAEQGHRIAVVEQLENPKETKGIVKRDIVRIISPATHISAQSISKPVNNFFACIVHLNSIFGLALIDLSTSEFIVTETDSIDVVFDELCKRPPKEILLSKKLQKSSAPLIAKIEKQFPIRLNYQDEWHFDHKLNYDFLTRHFHVHNLDGYGMQGKVTGINASGALLSYLSETLSQDISHIKRIRHEQLNQYVQIDHSTLKNLEIFRSTSGQSEGSLLHLLNQTQTAMGNRLLNFWVTHPLTHLQTIENRHQALEELLHHPSILTSFIDQLSPIRDIERLMMRIHSGFASPRELLYLAVSLANVPKVCQLTHQLQSPLFDSINSQLIDTTPLTTQITQALVDEPPIKITEGKIFRNGYNRELDELYLIKSKSSEWLDNYQTALRNHFDIKTLKVNFTRAFGYYIEVSKGQSHKMPSQFERRQTLVNAERFISPELKEFEAKVLSAEEKIQTLEHELFVHLRGEVAKHITQVNQVAAQIANIDALVSLAQVAKHHQYTRPKMSLEQALSIVEGRHPIVEKMAGQDGFVPNNTSMNPTDSRLAIITGPNMAGKSTYIRQVALITLMAQIGSFVPAQSAEIGIVDKVFSRIGASDDLSRGQSTFMVEMSETANILNNATSKSLVILDEIGRGTSTYDGISIARSVAEFLLTDPICSPKTLFATHYSELCDLEEKHSNAINLRVAVEEDEDDIVFLHKIIRGSTDKSYGIHVAELAGLPPQVVQMARAHLQQLEEHSPTLKEEKKPAIPANEDQLYLFEPSSDQRKIDKKVLKELKGLSVEEMTPLDALQRLNEWKKRYEF